MTDKTLHSKENRIKIAKAKLLDTQREVNNLKTLAESFNTILRI